MSWWLWVLVGVVATHLVYAAIFVLYWWWLSRGEKSQEQIARDFQTVRDAVRDSHTRRHSDAQPRDPHRW